MHKVILKINFLKLEQNILKYLRIKKINNKNKRHICFWKKEYLQSILG